MCGIVGIYSTHARFSRDDMSNMLQHISHRGPDDDGIMAFNTTDRQNAHNEGNLIFGHKRLSILDLSSLEHQPMSTKDNSL